jgi:CHAT domain-containing protein/Tfp pilus assembly protein PilF
MVKRTLLSLWLIALACAASAAGEARAQQTPAAPAAPAVVKLALALAEARTDDERGSMLESNRGLVSAALIEQLKEQAATLWGQGKVEQMTGSYSAALLAARLLDDKRRIAEMLYLLAQSLSFQGRFGEATRYAQECLQVARESGDAHHVSLGLTVLALVARAAGDYDLAIERLQEALKTATSHGDNAAAREAAQNLSILLNFRGDYVQALAYAQKCLAYARDMRSAHAISRSLAYLGEIYTQLGDYARAHESFDEALKILSLADAKDKTRLGHAMAGKADVYSKQGDYARALDLLRQAVAIAEEMNSPPNVAALLNDMAKVYFNMGDIPRALETYNRALELAKRVGFQEVVLTTTVNIGATYLRQGDLPQAMAYARAGFELAQKAGNRLEVWNALIAIANIYREQGDDARAAETYQRCLALAEEMKSQLLVSQTLGELGALYYRGGKYQQAHDASVRGANVARSLGLEEVLWKTLTIKGQCDLALGRREDAARAFSEAVEVIEKLNRQVTGSEDTLRRFFENKTEPYLGMVNLLVGQGSDLAALTYAERTKGRVLIDLLHNGRIDVQKTMTAGEIERERELKYRLVSLNSQLSQEHLAPRPDAAAIEKLKARLDEARFDYESFQSALYERRPTLRLQRADIPPLSGQDIARVLEDGAATVEYVLAHDKLHIFVLTRRAAAPGGFDLKVTTTPINGQKLAAMIKKFRAQVGERDLGFAALSRELYDLLVGPVAAQLASKTTLCIIPDGVLWELPFQALLNGRGEYLLVEHAIYYSPSLSVLKEILKRSPAGEGVDGAARGARGPRRQTLFAVANPRVGGPAPAPETAVRGDLRFLPLPEAEHEVAELSGIYGRSNSRVIVGGDALEETVKREAGKFKVLHFATHAVLDDRSPLYSFMLLARRPGSDDEDGLLEMWEVLNMNLDADLVTLSACETARGSVSAGEGMIGMSWAFFVAGSSSLIASQWQVDSASTSSMMVKLYSDLRNQSAGSGSPATKAQALRRAALNLRRTKRYELPYYWAGFVLIGDPH